MLDTFHPPCVTAAAAYAFERTFYKSARGFVAENECGRSLEVFLSQTTK
jgi:hypothetical protein